MPSLILRSVSVFAFEECLSVCQFLPGFLLSLLNLLLLFGSLAWDFFGALKGTVTLFCKSSFEVVICIFYILVIGL